MLYFIKRKNFCSVKDSVKRMRRQTTGWEKISAKDITDNGLLCKVHNRTLKTQLKKHEKPD